MGKTTYKKLYLRCTFTNEELSDIAATMADKAQELKRIDAEIDNAARKYRDGYEMRDVECEETLDFENGVVRYWRTDTGDLAKERKMTNEERQMRLDEVETEAGQQALAGNDPGDPEHDAHISNVGRFMSQERAVQM